MDDFKLCSDTVLMKTGFFTVFATLQCTVVTGGEEISVGKSRAAPTTNRDGCRGEVQCLDCMGDGHWVRWHHVMMLGARGRYRMLNAWVVGDEAGCKSEVQYVDYMGDGQVVGARVRCRMLIA